MSAPRRYRVGLVGAGYVAEFHVKALRRLPQVDLVGISDLAFARAEALARELAIPAAHPSLAAMAEQGLDVVHVLTPPDTHVAVALEAMERGCDVLVEKPLATSVEDCDRIIAAAARLGRRAAVNHSQLRDPQIVRALDAIRAGAVGEPVSIDFFNSSEYAPWAGGPLPPQYRDGGYPFRDLGVHALYLIREILGPIEDVHVAYGTRGGDPNLCFDEWHALVRCARGRGHVQLSWNVHPLQNFLLVHGTRGTLRVDLAFMFSTRRRATPLPKAAERVLNAFADALPPLWQVPLNVGRFVSGRLQPYQGLHDAVRDFYASLATGGAPPATLEAGREVVGWVEHGARPADEAKRVRDARYQPSGKPAVAVTGANGFLGRHLVRRLLDEGHTLRLLVRRPPEAALGDDPRVEVALGDLGDAAWVTRALAGATVVYHLGAAMGGSWEDFERGTVQGTRNVVDACLALDVPKLVYVSSLSVIDWAGADGGPPITEDAALEPQAELRGFYTQSKLAAERLVSEAVRARGLPATIVRPGQIFGPGALIEGATGALHVGRRLVVLGDGANRLPLVHVDDVVDALLLAAARGTADGAIYQLVDDTPVTQRALTEQVAAATGLRTVFLPQPLVLALTRCIELLGRLFRRSVPLTRYRLRSAQARLTFDSGKARRDLGWTPRTGVDAGLRKLLDRSYAG